MAPLTSDEVCAGERVSADDDSASDTRADDDAEHDVRACRRAIGRLGECEAIGVVHDANFTVQMFLEIARQRLSVEPHRIGILYESGVGNDDPRNPDTNGSHATDFLLDVGDERRDRHERFLIARRRRDALPNELFSVSVHRERFDLGAAEIDADAEFGFGHGE